jgi:hypothetical protein
VSQVPLAGPLKELEVPDTFGSEPAAIGHLLRGESSAPPPRLLLGQIGCSGSVARLRHTACTRLLEAGVTLPIIARILGWSASTTVRMAQRYGHIGPDAQRQAMDSLMQVAPAGPQDAETLASVTVPESTLGH